jgi:predicted nucleic acid-binding Zn ribbon protein
MAAPRRRATSRTPLLKPRASPEEEALHHFQLDAQRKQYRPPPAKKIADVMSGLLARTGYAKVLTSGGLAQAWATSVGEKLAKHTRVGSVKRGTLEVLVRNSAVLQELTFDKNGILKRLTVASAEHKIRDLRFRVGPID